MSHAKAKELIIRYFDANGWPMDVDEVKFEKRSSLRSDPGNDSMWIVEIERHRPTLGDSYTRGLPMNAFETYAMRYEVDITSGDVRTLDDRHIDLQISVDGLVDDELSMERIDLSIEPIEGKKYRIAESVCNETFVVTSLEDAIDWVVSLGERIKYFFTKETLHSYLNTTPELTEEFCKKLNKDFSACLDGQLTDMATELWKSRDD